MRVLVIFLSYYKLTRYILFRKVLDFDILCKNILSQSDSRIFLISILKNQLKKELIFFHVIRHP